MFSFVVQVLLYQIEKATALCRRHLSYYSAFSFPFLLGGGRGRRALLGMGFVLFLDKLLDRFY